MLVLINVRQRSTFSKGLSTWVDEFHSHVENGLVTEAWWTNVEVGCADTLCTEEMGVTHRQRPCRRNLAQLLHRAVKVNSLCSAQSQRSDVLRANVCTVPLGIELLEKKCASQSSVTAQHNTTVTLCCNHTFINLIPMCLEHYSFGMYAASHGTGSLVGLLRSLEHDLDIVNTNSHIRMYLLVKLRHCGC